LCAVQAARHLGAGKIIAIDVDDAKLARAKYFGATDAIDSRLGKTSKTIADIGGTAGLDVAIDASGHPSAMECAHTSIRRGGIAIVAGNPPRGTKFAVDPFDLIAGRRLVGSVGGDSVPDRDFPKYATLAEDGAFDLSGMISHQGGLDDLPEFLDALGRGEVTRATIIFKPL
jgi:S-(hydroxymethyl)glutathione dehydrogenase/alcohol dehydrogenase